MAPSVSTLAMVATVCLAFTASAALALEDRDPAVVAACEARCATLQEDDGFFAEREKICMASMRAGPRPKNGNACKSGFHMAAVKAACESGCMHNLRCNRPALAVNHPDFSKQYGKCSKYFHELPRPRIHRSCETGFAGALTHGCRFASGFLDEAFDEVAAQQAEVAAAADGVITDEDEMDRILGATSLDEIPSAPSSHVRGSAAAEKAAAEKAAAEKAAAEKAAAEKAAAEKARAEAHAAELKAEQEAAAAAKAAEEAARKLEEAKAAEADANAKAANLDASSDLGL